MSKIRDLPEITSLDGNDLLYTVDVSSGPNGGRKITKDNLKTSVAQSAAEIKTAYESNADTNAFTDAEKTKLFGIEAGATGDQNAAEVPFDNVDSGLAAMDVQEAIDELALGTQVDFKPTVVPGRILHYSAGTARFDDVFYELSDGNILLNASVTAGEVYLDLDGIVKQTGSGVTAPPLTIVIAKFSTDLSEIIALTDERVKNAQNLVRGILSDVRDVRAGASSVAGASGRLSDAQHKHNILTGAASSLDATSTNTEGSSINLARADHTHDLSTGAASNQTPDQVSAEGSSANLARADHVHNIPSGTPITTLAPSVSNAKGVADNFALSDHTHTISTALVGSISTIQPDDAAAAGTADNFARGDHKHAIAAASASTQTPDQANAEGASTSFARADHTHQLVTAAPLTTLSPATSNAQGAATSFARSDHGHAVATALVADITTIQPDDAAAAGTANTFARGDHKHAIVAAAASTQTPDQANAEGASTSFARADHVHAIATAAASSISTSTTNTQGSASSFARSDHTHAVTITNSEATATADDTTASLTDVLMVSMTLTPAAGTYFVMWSGSIVNSGNGAERTWVSLYLNGVQVSATERSIGTSGGAYSPSMTHAVIVTPGSQAIELRWRAAAGTSTVHSRRLSIAKVG